PRPHLPPLSLHDALPILRRVNLSLSLRRAIQGRSGIGLSLVDAAPRLVKLDRRLRLDRDCHMPRSVRAPPSLRQRAERNLTLARDRKSTRLNSSHVSISY